MIVRTLCYKHLPLYNALKEATAYNLIRLHSLLEMGVNEVPILGSASWITSSYVKGRKQHKNSIGKQG